MGEYDNCTNPMCLTVGPHQIPAQCSRAPWVPYDRLTHNPEVRKPRDCSACVANNSRELTPVERSHGRQRTCCDTTSAQMHSSLCPHYEMMVRRGLDSYMAEQQATVAGWENGALPSFGRQNGKQRFADVVKRFIETYYAPGQVVTVRLPKRLTDPPVVVQQHDQRAEDATYENETRLHR